MPKKTKTELLEDKLMAEKARLFAEVEQKNDVNIVKEMKSVASSIKKKNSGSSLDLNSLVTSSASSMLSKNMKMSTSTHRQKNPDAINGDREVEAIDEESEKDFSDTEELEVHAAAVLIEEDSISQEDEI